MYKLLRSFLFMLPAEVAHGFTTSMLKALFKIPFTKSIFSSLYTIEHPALFTEVFGLHFKNPVGLAAGFDKNADYINQFDAMGFGFIEIGTVTPKSQAGNPKPRLFRLKTDQGLINRMGFNNNGMDSALKNLKKKPKNVLIGGNIGKNKVTPNEKAINDYLKCFETLYPAVDYFVVNVSSPNTPDLRQLQDKKPLQELLEAVQDLNRSQIKEKPLLLKIAPDLNHHQLEDILEVVEKCELDGIIATNTTIDRSNLETPQSKIDQIGNGGLSGKPLNEKSTEIIRFINDRKPNLPLIAVGGIMSAEDALEKLDAGADLIQVYSGLVYKGPLLIKKICKAIKFDRLERSR